MHASSACEKTPIASHAVCGSNSLAYTMPARYLFPPIHLVMENQPGACDFYKSKQPCCDLEQHLERMVEHEVREVITSFLGGCRSRAASHTAPCWAADFGANNGWMSMMMLSLGVNVISVEPASDFAAAIKQSAALKYAPIAVATFP